MIWKAKALVPGDLKVVNRFAFLPKKIGEKKIWMEHYQMLYVYTCKTIRIEGYVTYKHYWKLVDIKILV